VPPDITVTPHGSGSWTVTATPDEIARLGGGDPAERLLLPDYSRQIGRRLGS
jgi:hypothetical protein